MDNQFKKNNEIRNSLYLEDFDRVPFLEKIYYEDEENIINEIEMRKQREIDLCEESYRKGLEEGKIISKNNMDQERENNINLIQKKIFDIEREINNKIRERFDTIFMETGEKIYQIAFSMFSNLMRQYGEKESKEYIKNSIPLLKSRDNIKITCCEEFYKNIYEYIINISDVKITSLLDESLRKGDFKISWDNGLLMHDVRMIMEDIEKKLNNSDVEK